MTTEGTVAQKVDTVILGAGCFWCVEAAFDRIKGVKEVEPGYMGGSKDHPTYKEVCTGETGHAEVAQIKYDPEEVSFADILRVFFTVHDPTKLNRQGNDIGTQYRSVIFYHTKEQKEIAEKAIDELNRSGAYDSPIVTELIEATVFYPAEDYHHDYYENNSDQPYCRLVITPKLRKVEKVFKDMLK